MSSKTHRKSGWTCESMPDGCLRIRRPESASVQVVRIMPAWLWLDHIHDHKSRLHLARVVRIDGDALPEWMEAWLLAEYLKERRKGPVFQRLCATMGREVGDGPGQWPLEAQSPGDGDTCYRVVGTLPLGGGEWHPLGETCFLGASEAYHAMHFGIRVAEEMARTR